MVLLCSYLVDKAGWIFWGHTDAQQFPAVAFRGFDHIELKSSLMTGLSFSQQNLQVPGG